MFWQGIRKKTLGLSTLLLLLCSSSELPFSLKQYKNNGFCENGPAQNKYLNCLLCSYLCVSCPSLCGLTIVTGLKSDYSVLRTAGVKFSTLVLANSAERGHFVRQHMNNARIIVLVNMKEPTPAIISEPCAEPSGVLHGFEHRPLLNVSSF